MLYNILKQKGDTVMPPKPKFSREDIINAAFDIVQKSGTDAMTARGRKISRHFVNADFYRVQ